MQSGGGCVRERVTGADAVSTLGSCADPVVGCNCFVVRARPKHLCGEVFADMDSYCMLQPAERRTSIGEIQFMGKSSRIVLRLLIRLTLLAVALQHAETICSAQQFSPSLYSGLHWRFIGPFRGGRSNAVTGVPGQPSTFYFGSVGGGVWKSENSGRTWTPIFDSQPVPSIGAIAVAPSNPNVIYVGTGESDMRSQISFGNGVYKSTDAGKTWTHVGLDDTRQIGRILVDARNADIVFVAALGHAYGGNAGRGVYRAKDGGASWEKVL